MKFAWASSISQIYKVRKITFIKKITCGVKLKTLRKHESKREKEAMNNIIMIIIISQKISVSLPGQKDDDDNTNNDGNMQL